MRKTLRRIGLVAGILVATIGVGSGVAAAAPASVSEAASIKAPAVINATWVYIGTYPISDCVSYMLWYNSQGYLAQCAAVSSTHAALYVYA
ncbi:hypothetical protein [Micromonospora sp. NPDC002575]|uniref:hypothetical protein n=1 Tax=Micromonospora sp. NPDC002575 TaxID=3364222 RepID=UPI0036882584